MQSDAILTNCTEYIYKFVMNYTNLTEFVKYMVAPDTFDAIKQYFSNYDESACLSIYAYPRDMLKYAETASGKTLTRLHVGFFNKAITNCYGYAIPSEALNARTFAATFTLTRRHKNYLDFSPYTKMQLYLPCVGTVDIDPAAWYGRSISIYYVIDLENGEISYTATDESKGIDLGMWSGQYAVEIPATSSRMAEIKGQAITGTITGAVQMLGGNMAGGAMTMLGSGLNAITAPAGISGGKASQGLAHAFCDSYPYIIETYFNPVEDDEAFASVHGMPLYAKRDFSSLAGYTVIDDVHLEGFGTATEGELQEIESLLKSGVHF